MFRRLFTFASVVSLLLLAATAVLWVRSYAAATIVPEVGTPGGGRWEVRSEAGAFHAEEAPRRRADTEARSARLRAIEAFAAAEGVEIGNGPRRQPEASAFLQLRRAVFDFLLTVLMHAYVSIRDAPLGPYVSLTMPYWSAACATSLLPASWLAGAAASRSRRRRRATVGRCTACGYDLRASPGRCPESGAMAPDGNYAAGRGRVRNGDRG
jgi:hypothetical protein